MKIKNQDTIIVLIGDDAGRQGQVTKVFPKENKILVDGINTYKRHLRAQGNQEGGVVTISRPIASSKVAVVCPHCKKSTRIGFEGIGKEKVRVCKKCGKPIIATEVKKKK